MFKKEQRREKGDVNKDNKLELCSQQVQKTEPVFCEWWPVADNGEMWDTKQKLRKFFFILLHFHLSVFIYC